MRLNPGRPTMTTPNADPKPRLVPCPSCRREIAYSTRNPWRPFCSERCRRVDLGAWASERYRVAAPAAEPPEGDDTPH